MDPRGSRVGKAGERVAQLGVSDAGTQGHRGWGPRGAGVGATPRPEGRGSPWCVILREVPDCGRTHSGQWLKKAVSEGK